MIWDHEVASSNLPAPTIFDSARKLVLGLVPELASIRLLALEG